ncbi:hypothetical protein HDU84_000271 [Entophlyctis sp. JEL0112]|nr:hypothetical protein HDU84_000271 [Entophlyctis sp. JEL0112]
MLRFVALVVASYLWRVVSLFVLVAIAPLVLLYPLGLWHVLPSQWYRRNGVRQHARGDTAALHVLQTRALRERVVVLYFHGNAGNRAAPNRIATYRSLAARLDLNVVAIDYRGFGDSDGSPTEEGLATDARAAFDWVVSQGVEHSQILLLGHSLGTGVAARLAADLEMEGIRPRGLVLQAAYASIIDAALEYNAFQVLPLLLPLKYIPKLEAYIKTCIIDRFSTMERIEQLRIPVLLMHGRLDREIPCKNSRRLFLAGVAAQQGSATDQVVLAAAANESAFSAAVAGLEDITSVSAEEGVGRRWVASKDKNIGPGPIKIMFVELAYAHHNNVQAFDLTYESMESLFDIDVDGQQRNTGQEASLSNLVE